MPADRPTLEVTSRRQLRQWLEHNHATSAGVWLVRWKKGTGHDYVTYDDVVEEALCFGWIDSQPRALDDQRSMLLLTPRKPTSRWSKLNRARVTRLDEAGLLTSAGRAAVDFAKTSGTWSALDEVEALSEPDDLRGALDANPQAREAWDQFPRSTRRAILEWILSAKRTDTRRARIDKTVSEAAIGRRANQWRQPGR